MLQQPQLALQRSGKHIKKTKEGLNKPHFWRGPSGCRVRPASPDSSSKIYRMNREARAGIRPI